MERLLVVNGPNLNLLGTREPAVYGTTTLAELDAMCAEWGAELGLSVHTFQSNHEGALIDALHDARGDFDGVVLNPGALTHSSYALHDAIDAIPIPTIEVHISNVEEREAWRRISVVRPACAGRIYGRGIEGYRWAMRQLFHRAEWPAEELSYGDHADCVVDIRMPVGEGPHRAVVVVHGGFWRHQWQRDTTDGIAIDLARRGFLTANVEYRRTGAGGGWPVTARDVADAIDAVARRGDVGQVAVVGHSAGGHLAVIARSMSRVPFLPVSLAGVLDLEAGIRDGVGGGAIEAFLGDVDPPQASPVRVAASGETLLVHGTEDDRVPLTQAVSYAAANPDAELVELPGVGHFDFLERSAPAWRAVLDRLASRLAV